MSWWIARVTAGRIPGRVPVLDRPRATQAGRTGVRGLMRGGAAIGAGALLGLAFPPFGWWPVAFLAVGALSLLTDGCSVRSGGLLGFGFGLGFFVLLLQWLHVVGWDAVLALATLQAAFLVPVGAAFAATSRRRGRMFWQSLVWIAAEAARDRVPFGGLPWGRLAFSQAGSPLGRLAAVGGAPLVSLAVALVGCALAAAVRAAAPADRPGMIRRSPLRRSVLRLVTVAEVFGVALAVPVAAGESDHVTVAVVQGNVPRAGYDTLAQQQVVFANHLAATHALAADVRAGRAPKPDLVVWPENASDFDPFGNLSVGLRIDAAVDDVDAPTLVGAVLVAGPRQLRNVGIVWTPGRGPGQMYTKRHPVPFGEYLPMRGLLTRLISRFARVPRNFEPGEQPGVLALGRTTIGEVICFEIAYDDLVRDVVRGGGQVLVVQTNNATYGRTGQPEQQLAISRLRAIEHGRAVVVAATSGISAVIEPDGALAYRTKEFTRDVSVTRIPLRTSLTMATRLGDWPEAAGCVLALGALRPGVGGMRRIRRSTGTTRTNGERGER